MTRGNRILVTSALTLGTILACGVTAHAQQQFGPSPQAMYKQHPGTAPTYVNYGAPTTTPQVAGLRAPVMPAPTTARPAARTSVRPATQSARTATPARRKAAPIRLSTGTSGR